mmetsp:Transcript_19363/g.29688  ORF Transcript_19363/g.29688 Transcript_19363/m.29688 type:complete len:90 (-) Transcript_19363:75-344(-)|eukprot:CAMPEP_0170493796 /NCGR_PEP_ID=MMETSP0208-20121228/14274_1 /TAXON_ID=197538 /ORGANISM="Strombidium inclinatum, Strain S3" /LENGTH=89 /DNA_ID=CAMNT_0010769761 /DNA_START=370 /DNA_END=639 /DNA_ORIENTATION=+
MKPVKNSILKTLKVANVKEALKIYQPNLGVTSNQEFYFNKLSASMMKNDKMTMGSNGMQFSFNTDTIKVGKNQASFTWYQVEPFTQKLC